MKNRGILAVVSGFSGSGKGTIMKELLQKYDNYALSISATTRQPREGEMHGKEYFFLSKEEFEQLIKEEKLIEYAQYVGNYYGTPSSFVEEQRDAGKDVILEIEVQGALQVKEKFPDTVLLFVTPPSAEELASRLRRRGTETEEVITKRMEQAVTESTLMDKYDYLVVNDSLQEAVETMHNILQMEHYKMSRNEEFVTDIQNDLKSSGGMK